MNYIRNKLYLRNHKRNKYIYSRNFLVRLYSTSSSFPTWNRRTTTQIVDINSSTCVDWQNWAARGFRGYCVRMWTLAVNALSSQLFIDVDTSLLLLLSEQTMNIECSQIQQCLYLVRCWLRPTECIFIFSVTSSWRNCLNVLITVIVLKEIFLLKYIII